MSESRYKYLYERLGDHSFQQLANALLSKQFSTFRALPLRQADGGRDGVDRADTARLLVFQTKWSLSGRERDPVEWLDAVVRKEQESLTRLAAAGVRRYMLVTNVSSTGKPGTGTFDALNDRLDAHAARLGFDQLTCVWRETLDAWVDSAETELKWTFAEMLAGWDLVRYLVTEQSGAAKEAELRSLIQSVSAAQWDEDKRIKFSQAGVDRSDLVDLFVDVTASHVQADKNHQPNGPEHVAVGGAAAHLVKSSRPYTLVRGAPGQGKSTLSQYVCQAHRVAFLPAIQADHLALPKAEPRFPIRADLSDYSNWLAGGEFAPRALDRTTRKAHPRRGEESSVECFLAAVITYESGGQQTSPKDVRALLERVPSLIVLDGLDEVGNRSARNRIVKEIDRFAARARNYTVPPKIIVTTRPSGGELPEPDLQLFDVVTLNALTDSQRRDYLRRWCTVNGIRGRDGRALRQAFLARSAEPYIAELAGNPMQLTILLDLLHEQGLAAPTQRTELYDKYVDLLLAREANKHPKTVREHRADLLEIVPFIGWYLHAHSEQEPQRARMSIDEIKAAMTHFQHSYGKQEKVVDALFTGASDRLWALASTTSGYYEFDILSLQEYFAARFLYESAGENNPDFDDTSVLRELLRRPYWHNTARFYGGNARGRGLYALTAAIEEELNDIAPEASFLGAWALLTDGVFQQRPREALAVLAAICSDRGIAILLRAFDRHELPGLLKVSTNEPNPVWQRLTKLVAADPLDPQNMVRVRAIRHVLGMNAEFVAWWTSELSRKDNAKQLDEWLKFGAAVEAGAGQPATSGNLTITATRASWVMSSGLIPSLDSGLEQSLLRAVLDGQAPAVTSTRSLPSQVAVALAPSSFYTTSSTGFTGASSKQQSRRSQAVRQLVASSSPYASIAAQRTFRRGEKGSTFPWARTSSALFQEAGRCWLVSEIAIIGAASPFASGHVKQAISDTLGPGSHPEALLPGTRAHANDTTWWLGQLKQCESPLDHAEWAFALWAVGSGATLGNLAAEWERTVEHLPPAWQQTVKRAAQEAAASGWLQTRVIPSQQWGPSFADLVALRRAPAAPVSTAPLLRLPQPRLQRESLLSIARQHRWLKVDDTPTYR